MNIITGITKFRASGKGLRVKSAKWLNFPILIFLLTLFVGGCASKKQVLEETISVKSDVKICSPIVREAERISNFQAVSRFMQSNDIRSQITGIITRINCSVADHIQTNQALFTVQPQESAALKKSKYSNQILTGYSDTVFAHINGQISKLNVQVGDFVQMGDVLANCIRANSMRIIAYIPVEQIGMIEKIKNCTVSLPDGTTVNGRISEKLASAEIQEQTQSYIIETEKPILLTENINLNVHFITEKIQEALFVPASAVLGNEEQTKFWVMKMVNDTICIKVPVDKGMKQDSLIQLIGTNLAINDRVISEGAYGLADSSRVQVLNSKIVPDNLNKPKGNSKSTSSRH
ncbi:MAG: HlyD family efflux transporter periplasmic adaptor subunit [Bacteroidia bacterium]